ncbi:PTS transporter subunit EIIC [Spiroplasma endosymbiont of Sarcophaga carnaria]|uniref:PTS transporter subunit EIIC n=1 Tax=Spiroplasma endosymbiont of Sarcophaga carnaria TaxID=3066303 RepID=UPI0030D18E70
MAFFGWAVIEGLMGIVPQWYYNNALLGHTPIGNFQDNQFWAIPHSQILYVFDFSVGDTIKGYGAKYNISMGVFGVILAGCLVALIYNKYSNVKLPAALGFFSGRRFVPMVTAAYFSWLEHLL